jgi:two-component system chemotaxis response regulator CheY
MTDDLLFLRALVASQDADLRDLFRQAASSSPTPVELLDAADATAASDSLVAGVDLVYLDGALPVAEIAQVVSTMRAAVKPPFSILLGTAATAGKVFDTDGLAGKPSRAEEARALVDRSLRVLVPSRALVVDDSSTMRSIVRKALAATRFPFEVSEAEEGLAALKLVREGDIQIVFLDYNMPEFSGLETLAEFKREQRRISVVLISSTQDEVVANQARAQGAVFLKKPFFPADIENALCGFYGLRALNPKRA